MRHGFKAVFILSLLCLAWFFFYFSSTILHVSQSRKYPDTHQANQPHQPPAAKPKEINQPPDKSTGIESLRFKKAKVGKGPLLFYIQPVQLDECDHEQAYFVCDPESAGKPQEYLRTKENIKIIHRFDQNTFLVEQGAVSGEIFLLDMARGQTREFIPHQNVSQLRVEGTTIYLATRKTVELENIQFESKYFLYAFDFASMKQPKLLFDEPLLDVIKPYEDSRLGFFNRSTPQLTLHNGCFWGVVDKPQPELWRISKDGLSNQLVMKLDPDWYKYPTYAFSPNAKLLALGTHVGDEPSNEFGKLVVIDLEKGVLVFQSDKIPIRISPLSSFGPVLKFVWLDDERIRFSETEILSQKGQYGVDGIEGFLKWVDLSIITGKRLNEKKYFQIGSGCWGHQMPSKDSLEIKSPPRRWEEGLFDREFGRVYIKGENKPIGDAITNHSGFEIMESSELEFSTDGKWAAVLTPKAGIELIDGIKRTKATLTKKWGYELTWMPAVNAATQSQPAPTKPVGNSLYVPH